MSTIHQTPQIKPVLNEAFADNGEHSHWELIDGNNGKILWSEQLATDGRELPKEIVDDISEFLRDAEYRGEYTIRKYGGSMIITFKDGTTAKMSIGMWKGAEVTLDSTDGREELEKENERLKALIKDAYYYRTGGPRDDHGWQQFKSANKL
jgi:hypothetical protein